MIVSYEPPSHTTKKAQKHILLVIIQEKLLKLNKSSIPLLVKSIKISTLNIIIESIDNESTLHNISKSLSLNI